MYRHLLVPLDGTPLAQLLTEQALALAGALGARVSFLHVQPDFGETEDGAVLHSVAPATFRDCAAGNAHAITGRAASAARAAGVAHDTHIVVGRQPAEAILEAAERLGCDLVVLASHGRRGWQVLRAGSVTRRLLQQAGLPLLVVAVASQIGQDDAARAVALIKAEHRSLGAVLHALLKVWREARETGRAPDYTLLGAMLFYIAEFPERLHHPKEDTYLFVRLRAHTDALDPLIADLQQQHAQGAVLFAQLRQALAQAQAGADGAAECFDAQIDAYARSQWRHMADEERLVLPAAQRYLTPEDWRAIAAAFGENGDPRFGAEQDEAFEQLLSRLLRLAAAAP